MRLPEAGRQRADIERNMARPMGLGDSPGSVIYCETMSKLISLSDSVISLSL